MGGAHPEARIYAHSQLLDVVRRDAGGHQGLRDTHPGVCINRIRNRGGHPGDPIGRYVEYDNDVEPPVLRFVDSDI